MQLEEYNTLCGSCMNNYTECYYLNNKYLLKKIGGKELLFSVLSNKKYFNKAIKYYNIDETKYFKQLVKEGSKKKIINFLRKNAKVNDIGGILKSKIGKKTICDTRKGENDGEILLLDSNDPSFKVSKSRSEKIISSIFCDKDEDKTYYDLIYYLNSILFGFTNNRFTCNNHFEDIIDFKTKLKVDDVNYYICDAELEN